MAISIHAPHAGSDPLKVPHFAPSFDFNPRSPCGERRRQLKEIFMFGIFQSTLPMRGATKHEQ